MKHVGDGPDAHRSSVPPPPPGPFSTPLQRRVTDLIAEGRITTEDAEAILEFADFLRETGPPGGPHKASVLLKHADFLGLDEEQRQRCRDHLEKNRGVNPSHGHRTGTYNPEERGQLAAQRVERAAEQMEDVWRTHANLGTTGSPIEHCRRLARALDDVGMLCEPDE